MTNDTMKQFIKSILKVVGLTWLKIIGIYLISSGLYYAIAVGNPIFMAMFFIGFFIIDLTPSLTKLIWNDCSH